VQKTIELPANRFNDGGRAMSSVKAANAAGEIDQPVAVDIFDNRAFSLRDKDRRGVISRLHNSLVAARHQRLRTRPGNLSAELNGRHK